MSTVTRNPVVDKITRMVEAETGLCFPPSRIDIEPGIHRAMKRARVTKLQQFAALLESGRLPLDDLVSEITVGETYFFREPQHFEFIQREVFPGIVRRRGGEHALRIWSAGCATGEEAYSLGIVLADAGLNGHVLGTDISRASLEKAVRATYRPWSLRGVDEALVQRCFRRTGDGWRLEDRFRTRVRFEFLNLARSAYPSVPAGIWGMDLILCRNVLMYLDADAVRRVTEGLSETLAEGGWLITSPSDLPLKLPPSMKPVATESGVFYRKEAPRLVVAPAPSADPGELNRTTGAPRAASSSASRTQDDRDVLSGTMQTEPAGEDVLADARAAFDAGQYARVLDLTQDLRDEAGAALHVRALANERGSDRALQELTPLFDRFPLSIELRLLQAVLQLDMNRFDEAARSFRRVLYLDRSLVIAHFMLATVLKRQGRLDEARRSYRRARDLAAARPPDERLPLMDNERAGTIARLASLEVALLDEQLPVTS